MGNRPMIEHKVCIDLPGEPVECWAETDVTVLLRKHRDVIFELHINKGAAYTIEAADDWIYDVAKKKRVQQGQFMDGQRYHVWISRAFKGELLLKQNGKVLQRYSMLQFGLVGDNPDPKAKPEPIIIAIGLNPVRQQPIAAAPATNPRVPSLLSYPQLAMPDYLRAPQPLDPQLAQGQWTCPVPVKLAAGTVQEPTQHAHVAEVDKHSFPQEVLDGIAAGGGDETALDTNKIATRNWLIAQLFGASAFLSDNKEWIKELFFERFRLMKIVHKNAGERWYVVFTGNPRLRKLVTAARYGVKHEKVLTIAGGAGTVESGAAAAWESSKGAFKKAGLIALIFTVTLDVAEWLHDYEQIGPDGKRKKDFADLLGKIGMDLAKAGLSAAIASVAVGLVVGLAAGVALPVGLIVIGTIAVAVGVGYGLDLIDKRVHATEHVTSWFRSIGESVKHAAEYLAKSMPKDYDSYPLMYMP